MDLIVIALYALAALIGVFSLVVLFWVWLVAKEALPYFERMNREAKEAEFARYRR